jgi:hypothetical protein
MLAFLFLSAGSSPRTAALEFMSALAEGNAEKLADLSLVQDRPKADLRKQWDDAVRYGKHYRFAWEVGAIRTDGDTATVRIDVYKTATEDAYADKYELILKKVNGSWKVDPTQIARDMFPYLPR